VSNPLAVDGTAEVSLALPDGWSVSPPLVRVPVEAGGRVRCDFDVTAGRQPAKRQRMAAELSIDGRRFGQQADAVIDVLADVDRSPTQT
jgi:hypothetical protein